MRFALLPSLCIFAYSAVSAAPVRPPAKPTPKEQAELKARSLDYAQRTLRLITEIHARYVRPIEENALVEAALRELHDAARRPMPQRLLKKVRKASTDSERLQLLIDARKSLGLHPNLAKHQDLLASCHAVVRLLDKHSGLVQNNNRRLQQLHEVTTGVGIVPAENLGAGPMRIREVIPGGPAQMAGVIPGDVITAVNGEAVKGKTSAEVLGKLNVPDAQLMDSIMPNADEAQAPSHSPIAKHVTLTLTRAGCAPRIVKLEQRLVRAETVLGVARNSDNSWNYWIDRDRRIAHVRITRLARGTASDLRTVLASLKEDGLKGLLLDLRWCEGGYVNECLLSAGLFLDDVTICEVRGRDKKVTKHPNGQAARFLKVPIIVLVNEKTSGGAELIVAALKDHGRAKVSGQRTRGKASVQTALYVGHPSVSLKLTTGHFHRPNGKTPHRTAETEASDTWGIKPDAELAHRLSPSLQKRLRRSWERQSLRPGTSRKSLPMDDVLADPQRLFALRAMEKALSKRAEAKPAPQGR